MKCFDRKYIGVSPNDQMRSYEFEEFENIPTKTDYILAYTGPNFDMFNEYTSGNVVMFWYEEPNCLVVPKMHDLIKENWSKIQKIFTICPHMVDFYNKRDNTDKWQFAFYPFNPKYTPVHGEKPYDVYYTGHSNHPIKRVFDTMRQYKECFVSSVFGDHMGVDYPTKLSLNAKSKVSVVHGILEWPEQHMNIARQYSEIPIFGQMNARREVPQMKSRIIEAAACKSLMLVYKDDWNYIESYFDEGVDFLYWKDLNDFKEKLHHVLNNYESFQPMIESAYNTLMNNFTTKHFFDQYLVNL
jgi:hypothetical protein